MTRFLRVSAVSVMCTIGAIAVSEAQTVTCQNAQYDPDVLSRFPNIAKACSDIISKDGEDYAVSRRDSIASTPAEGSPSASSRLMAAIQSSFRSGPGPICECW